MSDKEKDAAFRAERRRQLRRGVKIQADTFATIASYLKEAATRIRAALASGVSEYEAWRLRTLQDEIRRAMGEFESRTGAAVLSGLDQSFAAGGDLVTRPLEVAGVRIEALLPRLDTRILDAMKSFQTDRIKDISTTAINKINVEIGQVALGVQTPFQAASKVAEILQSPEKRARLIVRTELGTAYSEAGQQRMEQAVAAGVDGLEKQWRRSGKLHPRLTHELADGQIVKVSEPFMVGGVPIMKPRDPVLDPKERINCGCSSLPFMKHWRVSTPGPRSYTAEEIAASRSVRQAEEVRAPLAPTPPAGRPARQFTDAELQRVLGGKRLAAVWNEHVGMPPQAFVDAMTTGLAPRSAVVETVRAEVGKLQLFVEFGRRGEMTRTLDFVERSVHHDYLQFDRGAQGQSVGKALLASQVALYQQLGIRRVELIANIDVGGYAWARYGFKPEHWSMLQADLRERLDDIAELGELPEVKALALGYINNPDPRALWLIADLRYIVGGETLGKRLLLDTYWNGVLDLTDAEALQRLWAYVKGKRNQTP